jgi:tight adherence protein B
MMDATLLYTAVGLLTMLALGGAGFALVGASGDKSRKRVMAISKTSAKGVSQKGAEDTNQQRRKNVQAMLKDLEAKQSEKKKRPSLRRRIEMAGLRVSVRMFWFYSIILGLAFGAGTFVSGQDFLFVFLAMFASGIGLPRWALNFLKNWREKRFTRDFATAIDMIVRSVKSGLPVNEALKVVSTEIPRPVGSEFNLLLENLKVGLTMEQALTRMYERMPTAEVNFFAIVMVIQQKAGGNLSEALENLTSVLRDRKRLAGKIKAMSSEAKAGALIIGSMPPGVLCMVYITTPEYIDLLFTTDLGKLMLVGCSIWMLIGILVMKKMVSFKY